MEQHFAANKRPAARDLLLFFHASLIRFRLFQFRVHITICLSIELANMRGTQNDGVLPFFGSLQWTRKLDVFICWRISIRSSGCVLLLRGKFMASLHKSWIWGLNNNLLNAELNSFPLSKALKKLYDKPKHPSVIALRSFIFTIATFFSSFSLSHSCHADDSRLTKGERKTQPKPLKELLCDKWSKHSMLSPKNAWHWDELCGNF